MKKNTNAPTGAACTSTVNTMKCALMGEHTEHRNTERTTGQHLRWSTVQDGRIKVQPYQGTKKQGDGWHEDAPPAPVAAPEPDDADDRVDERPARHTVCGAKLPGVGSCKLFTGHAGDHFTESKGVAHAWDRDGDNSWDICADLLELCHGDKGPKKLPEEAQTICQRPGEHDGPHRGLGHIGNHLDEWTRNGPGCTSHPKMKIDTVAELLGRGRLDEADDDGEDTVHLGYAGSVEHVPELDDEPDEPPEPADSREPSLADICDKCKQELGAHDGVKCPKPYGFVLLSRGEILCKDGEFHDSDLVGLGGERAPQVYKTKAAAGASARHQHRVTEIVPWHGAPDRKPAPTPPKPVAALDVAKLTDDIMDKHGEALAATPAAPRILGMRRHPAAKLFPLMEGEVLERFIARIGKSGQRKRIVLVTIGGETFILDGSNRGIACERLGITPLFEDYEGPKDMASLVAYSIDANGDGRRHLDESQRAWAGAEGARLCQGNPGDRETGRSAGLQTQAEIAASLGVSERLVRKAKTVREKTTPKVHEAIAKGKLALEGAEKLMNLPKAKQDEIAEEALAKKEGKLKSGRVKALVQQEEKRAVVRKINEQRVAPMPAGEFGVIYGDYPWLYDNSDQHEGSRGHMDYPGMTMDEILAHAHEAAKRAGKDCVIALWFTNAFLHEIGRVLAAYGATMRTAITWDKATKNDKDKMGIGTWARPRTEHLVIASIGEPVHTLNEIATLIRAEVREPGRKPEVFAELLAKHCSGPFLELFARADRGGLWTCWGAETDKFATEAA